MSTVLAPRDAAALVAGGGVDVVDVREPQEFALGHVPGARLVPLEQLRKAPAAALPRDNVLFVCAKGVRSQTAAKVAEGHGLKQVFSLDGGTLAWAKAGLPVEVPAPAPKRAPAAAAPPVASRPTAAPAAASKAAVASKPAQASVKEKVATAEAAETAEPALDAIVGANLRELRKRKGLTLDALAKLAGVSRALLGQIELGKSVPSIGIVWKIAQSLEVPFSTLLALPPRVGTSVLRRASAKRLLSADGRFASRALFPFGEARTVEFYELWLAPHGREEAEAHRPGTRENLVVVAGRLELQVGGEKFSLDAGDAVVFAADVAHRYENPGSEECWMHLVMTYMDPVS